MYTKIKQTPISHELNSYLMSTYPQTAERIAKWTLPRMAAQYINGSPDEGSWQVVRAIVADGAMLWTLEQWTHNNGYHCKVELITRSEFLSLIRS